MVERDLATLQRWMLSACTGLGGGPDLRVADVVRGSDRLGAEDRLAVYARGYRVRLHEYLKAEYPALRALVGDQVFGLFADGYLATHPPASPSVFDLGAGFADFLADTRPDPHEPPGSPDRLPAALARLERARAEARRAPGVETDADHRPVDPFDVLRPEELVVRTPPGLRLPHLDFALVDTLAAVDRGARPPVPEPADTHYAVARTGYRVRVHVLEPWQHTFLGLCAGDGTPLPTATTATDRRHDVPRIRARLITWLPSAAAAGMVTCVRRGGSARAARPGRSR
ncbi:DNA-binding domain-containing protein [Actinosynnema sp. NPDC053489]|uniref:DNA-binding domain-containing protein n=1 Tax=Actinosynnema sp. NPDC053489 TaxID=3363916 RepID=UPI0037C70363